MVSKRKQAMSFVAVLVLMAIVMVNLVATTPIVTQKYKKITTSKAGVGEVNVQDKRSGGAFICYKDKDGNKKSELYLNGKIQTGYPKNNCEFNPPEAEEYKIVLIGGGAGGAKATAQRKMIIEEESSIDFGKKYILFSGKGKNIDDNINSDLFSNYYIVFNDENVGISLTSPLFVNEGLFSNEIKDKKIIDYSTNTLKFNNTVIGNISAPTAYTEKIHTIADKIGTDIGFYNSSTKSTEKRIPLYWTKPEYTVFLATGGKAGSVEKRTVSFLPETIGNDDMILGDGGPSENGGKETELILRDSEGNQISYNAAGGKNTKNTVKETNYTNSYDNKDSLAVEGKLPDYVIDFADFERTSSKFYITTVGGAETVELRNSSYPGAGGAGAHCNYSDTSVVGGLVTEEPDKTSMDVTVDCPDGGGAGASGAIIIKW